MSTAAAASSFPVQQSAESPTPQFTSETVDCLICGNDDFETVIVAGDPLTGIGGNFRVVRCRDCQMVFTNPRPTPESIGAFYPQEYDPYQKQQTARGIRGRIKQRLQSAVLQTYFGYPPQPTHSRTRFLAMMGLRQIRRSRPRQSWIPYRSPGRLLDFGCGANTFLEEMRSFGWAVQGLDMSADVAADVQNRTGIKIHVGTLPHPDIQPASFDAVTMWNSLEHVHYPRETVRCAGEALRPGGILVIGVPNIDSWSFRRFQHHWHGLELPRHLSHFTPKTLCDVVEREGFRVLSLQQIARVGWIRHSIRRAIKNGDASWQLRACQQKSIALRIADWTERTEQADFIRVIAEKQQPSAEGNHEHG